MKNQKHPMILMKIFIFIGESKIHAGLCPFHHRKWHVFYGFGVKYMNFFHVLCPWVPVVSPKGNIDTGSIGIRKPSYQRQLVLMHGLK